MLGQSVWPVSILHFTQACHLVSSLNYHIHLCVSSKPKNFSLAKSFQHDVVHITQQTLLDSTLLIVSILLFLSLYQLFAWRHVCLFLATNIQNSPHVAKNNFITPCLIHKNGLHNAKKNRSRRQIVHISIFNERQYRTCHPPPSPPLYVLGPVLNAFIR